MTNQELVALVRKNPVVVAGVVLALAFGMASYFRSDGIPTAEADRDAKNAEADRLALNIKHAAQLNEQLAALAAARDAIEPRLIHPGELATNLQYFYKLEAETGTKLVELHQNAPPPTRAPLKTLFNPVSFSLTVEGDYASVLTFLRRVEGGAHYCRVLSAVMRSTAPTADRNDAVRLALGLELLGTP
jgi:hypothetical protein